MSDLNSPARYVGGTLYICDRCGAETINEPCQCKSLPSGITTTITTTTGTTDSVYFRLGNGRCARCGKPYVYVGDVPAMSPPLWCTCPVEVPSVFGPKGSGGLYDALMRDRARERGKAAPWECPRCHAINAPHVDRCSCTGEGS